MRLPLFALLLISAVLGGAIAQAQQLEKVSRIGWLSLGSQRSPEAQAFRQGLRELGYIEGENIAIEYRLVRDERFELLGEYARELVRLGVDVIVGPSTLAARYAKSATQKVPIVMVSHDPVGTGLVADMARPEGNVTGLSDLAPDLAVKRLELVKELLPRLSRVAVLWNFHHRLSEQRAGEQRASLEWRQTEAGAQAMGIPLQVQEWNGRMPQLRAAFEGAARGRPDALLTLVSPIVKREQKLIVDLATKSGLPTIYDDRAFMEVGGLISYGTNWAALYRRAASYVDKILKGARPQDLPVGAPTQFELIINLKRAEEIGLNIPPRILAQADRVIR